jgi:putative hydrolase of the HAD superfamily
MNDWLDAVLHNRQPMAPMPTGVEPQLQKLASIRAVIFDVYGTLLISGSGDVGSADQEDRGAFISDALAAVGYPFEQRPVPTIDDLHAEIKRANDLRTGVDCPKPEVDIVEAWRATIGRSGADTLAEDTGAMVRLASEYESRANPTWPMPAATDLLRELSEKGFAMGIVSNAQVFTIRLMEDLLGTSLRGGGFDLDLCIFSNRFRQAKPGPRMFDVLREGLSRRGIEPAEAVYVGNDMLNDVWAASVAGLKTAWFAGDRRSCRPRDDDPRCRSLRPDIVVTELMQLQKCLAID